MRTTRNTRLRVAASVSGALGAALFLAACSGGVDGSSPDPLGEGLAYGSSKADYQSAFADVEPIALKLQVEGPDGSLNNGGLIAWASAVEEWSDGRITFDIGYSNSFVPAANERAAGLADGRIDASFFLPYYNPDVFPTLTTLTDATFLDGNRSLSTLASTGWVTEMALELPEYAEEARDNGVHILTLSPSANIPGIFCKESRSSLSDFSGVPVSASGQGRFAQLAALGFTPQSLAFTELYEALERNVVQCGSTVPAALETIGAVELVPYAVADPEASLVGFPNFLAVSQVTWDSLPLIAQQLLFDRLDTFLAGEFRALSERNANWLDRIQAEGGGIAPLSDDARAALQEANRVLLAELAQRGADTETFVSAAERWSGVVDHDLYPDVTTSLEEFLAGRDYETIDVQPFIDAFFDDVLLEHRPR